MDDLSSRLNFFLRHLGHEVIYMGNCLKSKVDKSMSSFEDNCNAETFCLKLAKALIEFSEGTMKLLSDLKTNINESDLDPCGEYREIFELLKNHIEKPFENQPNIDFKNEMYKISQSGLQLDDIKKTEQLKNTENSKSLHPLDIVGYNLNIYEYDFISLCDEVFDKEITASNDEIPETCNNQLTINAGSSTVQVQDEVNFPDSQIVDVQYDSDDSIFSRETVCDNRNTNESDSDDILQCFSESSDSAQFSISSEKEDSQNCN
ncbi:hypothetical protein ABEB36_003091 [Hypothenemus hampei]